MTGDALGDAPVCTCIGTLLGHCVAAGGSGDAPGSVNDSWRSRFFYIYFAEIVYFADPYLSCMSISPMVLYFAEHHGIWYYFGTSFQLMSIWKPIAETVFWNFNFVDSGLFSV